MAAPLLARAIPHLPLSHWPATDRTPTTITTTSAATSTTTTTTTTDWDADSDSSNDRSGPTTAPLTRKHQRWQQQQLALAVLPPLPARPDALALAPPPAFPHPHPHEALAVWVPRTPAGGWESSCAAAALTVTVALAAAQQGGVPPGLLHMVSPFRSQHDEVRALGKGGFGAVTLVRSRLDHRLAAVKAVRFWSQLPPWVPPQELEAQHDKLLREVRALSALSWSPHVVRYSHAWVEPDWPRMGMQLATQARRHPALAHLLQQMGPSGTACGDQHPLLQLLPDALASASKVDGLLSKVEQGGPGSPHQHQQQQHIRAHVVPPSAIITTLSDGSSVTVSASGSASPTSSFTETSVTNADEALDVVDASLGWQPRRSRSGRLFGDAVVMTGHGGASAQGLQGQQQQQGGWQAPGVLGRVPSQGVLGRAQSQGVLGRVPSQGMLAGGRAPSCTIQEVNDAGESDAAPVLLQPQQPQQQQQPQGHVVAGSDLQRDMTPALLMMGGKEGGHGSDSSSSSSSSSGRSGDGSGSSWSSSGSGSDGEGDRSNGHSGSSSSSWSSSGSGSGSSSSGSTSGEGDDASFWDVDNSAEESHNSAFTFASRSVTTTSSSALSPRPAPSSNSMATLSSLSPRPAPNALPAPAASATTQDLLSPHPAPSPGSLAIVPSVLSPFQAANHHHHHQHHHHHHHSQRRHHTHKRHGPQLPFPAHPNHQQKSDAASTKCDVLSSAGITRWPYVLFISMEPVQGVTLDQWLIQRRKHHRQQAAAVSTAAAASAGGMVDSGGRGGGRVSGSGGVVGGAGSGGAGGGGGGGVGLGLGEKDIFMQLVEGLVHVHAAGIIHRDVKPSNIFIVPQPLPPHTQPTTQHPASSFRTAYSAAYGTAASSSPVPAQLRTMSGSSGGGSCRHGNGSLGGGSGGGATEQVCGSGLLVKLGDFGLSVLLDEGLMAGSGISRGDSSAGDGDGDGSGDGGGGGAGARQRHPDVSIHTATSSSSGGRGAARGVSAASSSLAQSFSVGGSRSSKVSAGGDPRLLEVAEGMGRKAVSRSSLSRSRHSGNGTSHNGNRTSHNGSGSRHSGSGSGLALSRGGSGGTIPMQGQEQQPGRHHRQHHQQQHHHQGAHVPGQQGSGLLRSSSHSHTSGVGTASYSAPEQQSGPGSYGPAVDVYPLGLILLELAVPFATGMERAVAMSDARRGLLPDALVSLLPVEASLIRSLLSPRPDHRPTCEQLLVGLRATWCGTPAGVAGTAADRAGGWAGGMAAAADGPVGLQQPFVSFPSSGSSGLSPRSSLAGSTATRTLSTPTRTLSTQLSAHVCHVNHVAVGPVQPTTQAACRGPHLGHVQPVGVESAACQQPDQQGEGGGGDVGPQQGVPPARTANGAHVHHMTHNVTPLPNGPRASGSGAPSLYCRPTVSGTFSRMGASYCHELLDAASQTDITLPSGATPVTWMATAEGRSSMHQVLLGSPCASEPGPVSTGHHDGITGAAKPATCTVTGCEEGSSVLAAPAPALVAAETSAPADHAKYEYRGQLLSGGQLLELLQQRDAELLARLSPSTL